MTFITTLLSFARLYYLSHEFILLGHRHCIRKKIFFAFPHSLQIPQTFIPSIFSSTFVFLIDFSSLEKSFVFQPFFPPLFYPFYLQFVKKSRSLLSDMEQDLRLKIGFIYVFIFLPYLLNLYPSSSIYRGCNPLKSMFEEGSIHLCFLLFFLFSFHFFSPIS